MSLADHASAGTLRLNGVGIAGRPGRFDISIAAGRIEHLDASSSERGGFVTPLLADVHVHLDKTFTIDRTAGKVTSLFDAIELMQRDKAHWSEDDVRRRATRALEDAYMHGVGAMRTHVDWMTPDVPVSWGVLNELRQVWRGRIDLQLAALAPADLLPEAGAAIAARVGKDGGVLGAFVYRNADLGAKVEQAFQLAARHDLQLDFHVDEGLEIEADGFAEIVSATRRHGMAGRVLCGHCCSLSLRDDDELARALSEAAEAGVALVALPTTNLYLQDRVEGRSPRRRGIAPIMEARAAGMEVMLASDNCRDVFYPFGDYDPLGVLRTAALASHLEPEDWLDSVTDLPARQCELEGGGPIQVGSRADFVWHDAADLRDLVSRPSTSRAVFRAGIHIHRPEQDQKTSWTIS